MRLSRRMEETDMSRGSSLNEKLDRSPEIKRSLSFLLLVALSAHVSAAEQPPSANTGNSEFQNVYYIKEPAWVQPEHSCKAESIRAATPTADFIDNRDGTVTHKQTGLVWMRCALGQNWDGKSCTGEAKKHNWKKALQAAPDFNAAGGYANHADWRLPNIKELDSIVETQCMWPSINTEIFPGTPSLRFWSSTLSTSHQYGYAWFIRFNDGYLDDGRTWAVFEGNEEPDSDGPRFFYPVRLVRGGQPLDSFDAGPLRGKKK